MPVQVLPDQQGGLGTVIGLVGGYLAGNPARKAKQAQQEIENKRNATNDARLDSEARDRAAEIQSTITKNNFEQHNTETDRIEAARQQALYEKYAKIVGAGPPKNVSPQQWATNLQNQANAEGLTDMKLRGDLIADGQAVVAARAPKLSQVTHGLPQPVTSGKGAWTPQHLSRHYLDAAALVQNSDMPEDQKKAAVTTYQKLAADATSGQTAAERERHDRAMEAAALHHDAVRVEVAGMPRRPGSGGSSRGSDGLTPYERSECSRPQECVAYSRACKPATARLPPSSARRYRPVQACTGIARCVRALLDGRSRIHAGRQRLEDQGPAGPGRRGTRARSDGCEIREEGDRSKPSGHERYSRPIARKHASAYADAYSGE